jgi:hypothetical protein
MLLFKENDELKKHIVFFRPMKPEQKIFCLTRLVEQHVAPPELNPFGDLLFLPTDCS